MRLFRFRHSPVVEHANRWFALEPQSWDAIVNRDDVHAWLSAAIAGRSPLPAPPDPADLLAPIGSQEVWAAGVTYYRSRTARMEESKSAGGGDFYDRVYGADRPELFFKASPHRVRGPGAPVRIRRDARVERARAGAGAGGDVERHDRRLHDRQRHELARHRGREPALPAAGQGLRRLLRARPGHLRHARAAAARRPRSGS